MEIKVNAWSFKPDENVRPQFRTLNYMEDLQKGRSILNILDMQAAACCTTKVNIKLFQSIYCDL